MRVGLNALHLVPGETGGMEVYARRLVPALLEEGLELVLFCGREATPSLQVEPWARDVEIVELPVRSRSRLLRVGAEQALLPAFTYRARLDILHNLFSTAPLGLPLPQVTTIHDVLYKRYPETTSRLNAKVADLLIDAAAVRSHRVIVPSASTKAELISLSGLAGDKIDVVPHGPGQEPVAPAAAREIEKLIGVGRSVVLSVAAKRAHKNLNRLIEALHLIEPRPLLVLPGYSTNQEQALRIKAGGDVLFLGWVSDSLLEALYQRAECFVFPSLAEGFGLPVLEAMARGLPVACSNSSSLPEVAGDAALYFDPLDVGAIKSAVETLLTDEALRQELAAKGLLQARKFSWRRAAKETALVYRHALRR